MKIGLAQINSTVGDITGNCSKIVEYINKYSSQCDIMVFPELALIGYPPQDLLLESKFIELANNELMTISEKVIDCIVLIGSIRKIDNNLYNTVAILSPKNTIEYRDKTLLPTYDVFEEDRYFTSSNNIQPIEISVNGELIKLGIHICEDLWNQENDIDVVNELADKNSDIFINLSASPFCVNRYNERIQMAKLKVEQYKKPYVYCNLIGGQDELVYDGGSFCLDSKANIVQQSVSFLESFEVVDFDKLIKKQSINEPEEKQLFEALKLGVKDYFQKTGHEKAVIGLSGGIDSALTCAIASYALGNENIYGYALPSKFSSDHSIEDAKILADNLGIHFSIIPIKEIHNQFLDTLSRDIDVKLPSLALENLQARIRGNILMALSNSFNALLLNTSNKTETALGYSTLYGDMCGALGVISDLNKHQVYSLSKWINKYFGECIIPENSINKEPSAELRDNQVDPFDYNEISPMVEKIISENKHLHQLTRQGYDRGDVQDILRKIRFSEFKRRQASPGIRVSKKAFGMGRKYPIVNQFKG